MTTLDELEKRADRLWEDFRLQCRQFPEHSATAIVRDLIKLLLTHPTHEPELDEEITAAKIRIDELEEDLRHSNANVDFWAKHSDAWEDRAHEAERIANLAMSTGLAECERLRGKVNDMAETWISVLAWQKLQKLDSDLRTTREQLAEMVSANAGAAEENETLRARVAELEAVRDSLVNRSRLFESCRNESIVRAERAEEELEREKNMHKECVNLSELQTARADLARATKERDDKHAGLEKMRRMYNEAASKLQEPKQVAFGARNPNDELRSERSAPGEVPKFASSEDDRLVKSPCGQYSLLQSHPSSAAVTAGWINGRIAEVWPAPSPGVHGPAHVVRVDDHDNVTVNGEVVVACGCVMSAMAIASSLRTALTSQPAGVEERIARAVQEERTSVVSYLRHLRDKEPRCTRNSLTGSMLPSASRAALDEAALFVEAGEHDRARGATKEGT